MNTRAIGPPARKVGQSLSDCRSHEGVATKHLPLLCAQLVSFSARRPRPCGLGRKGAPARRVVDCLPTGGPAEIYACGAEPIPKAPTNVEDGHGRVPRSGSPCSAQESPAFRHGEWSISIAEPSDCAALETYRELSLKLLRARIRDELLAHLEAAGLLHVPEHPLSVHTLQSVSGKRALPEPENHRVAIGEKWVTIKVAPRLS
jgi:hypothetical protein